MLVEIQALVGSTPYPSPRRVTNGVDTSRVLQILAVLEKRAGFRLGAKDVFLNVTGGISVDDPAIDLAVVAAILSSNEDIPVDKDFCFAGEIIEQRRTRDFCALGDLVHGCGIDPGAPETLSGRIKDCSTRPSLVTLAP